MWDDIDRILFKPSWPDRLTHIISLLRRPDAGKSIFRARSVTWTPRMHMNTIRRRTLSLQSRKVLPPFRPACQISQPWSYFQTHLMGSRCIDLAGKHSRALRSQPFAAYAMFNPIRRRSSTSLRRQ